MCCIDLKVFIPMQQATLALHHRTNQLCLRAREAVLRGDQAAVPLLLNKGEREILGAAEEVTEVKHGLFQHAYLSFLLMILGAFNVIC